MTTPPQKQNPTPKKKAATRKPYPTGTAVEIRNQLDRSWSGGFSVSAIDADGRYEITRTSDGSVLPQPFDAASVRRVRKKSTNTMWWV